MGRAGGAVDHAFLDALHDPGEAEEIVGKVPVHVRHAGAPRGRAIAFDHFFQLGDAQCLAIKVQHPAAPAVFRHPRHRDISEVRQRITQGRQFPVEHGQHLGFGLGPDHVVDPVIAMNHAGAGLFGQGCGQERDQALHRIHRFGFGQLVLLGPAFDLAAEVVARLAIVRQSGRIDIDRVQARQRIDHCVIGRAAIVRGVVGHRAVPDGAPVDHAHHVEPAADHAVIGAQAILRGNRPPGLLQRSLDLVFAVNRMGRGQQRTKRLAPQHVVSARRLDLVGRVGLAALELGQLHRALIARHIGFQPGGQLALVQPVGAFGFDRADEIGFGIQCRCVVHHALTDQTR